MGEGHGFGVPMHLGPFDVVVIGASAGGPPALEQVLSGIPADFQAPVVICQHMPPGATESFAHRLNGLYPQGVTEAQSGERLSPGHAYLAPGGQQTRVTRYGGVTRLLVDPDFADSLYVPSVDVLFSSVARACASHTLAVMLTGMGADGACGMLAVREAGGYTMSQTPETAFAPSMPESAIEAGAVCEQVPLDRLAGRITRLVQRSSELG